MPFHYPHPLVLALLTAMYVDASVGPPEVDPQPSQLTGGIFQYQVARGDSLAVIGSRFGIDPAEIAARTGLKPNRVLTPGQVLELDNRHIVPAVDDDVSVVINVPQRMLFLKEGEGRAGYPVAVGRRDWPTPVGDFTVVLKEERPTWDVPESIQLEMRREGRTVLEKVPPGPDNPLGEFWLGLSIGSVGIHGTNAPGSIFKYVTHGCIRMHPHDIAILFPRAFPGMRGRIVYAPVLLARTDEGIFLEAHPDIYRRMKGDPLAAVRNIAAAGGITDRVHWVRVQRVLEERRGIAISVANATPPLSFLN